MDYVGYNLQSEEEDKQLIEKDKYHCCAECCKEINSYRDTYLVIINGDFIHKGCFDAYFKHFVR